MMEEAPFSPENFSDDADDALKTTITSIVEDKSLDQEDPKETLDPPELLANEGTVKELGLHSTTINDSAEKSTTEKEPQENEDKLSCPVVINNISSVHDLQFENGTLDSDAHQKQISDKDKGASGVPAEEKEQGSKQIEATETDDGTREKSDDLNHDDQSHDGLVSEECSSPQKENSSPQKENSSPQKENSSPQKENSSPQKESSSPQKENFSPQKENFSLQKENSSPQNENSSPQKESSSPQKNSSSPQKENSSPRKKRVGSPAKEVYGKEQDSTEESSSIQRKKLRTSLKDEQLPKQSPAQSKLLNKPYQSTGKKRGRPPILKKVFEINKNTGVKTSKSNKTINKDSIPTQEDRSIEKKSDETQASKAPVPLRRARQPDNFDFEKLSFFLPESWLFIGSIRQAGANAGQIDMYYWTPPPRVKLRSRQELMAYMQHHGLDYDPLDFFRRADVPPLVTKGILKYYDSKTVVLAASDEALISQLVFSNGARQRRAKGKTIGKEENAQKILKKIKQKVYTKPKHKGFPHRKYMTKKQRSGLSFQPLPKTESLSPTIHNPQIESPEETSDELTERSLSVLAAKRRAPSPELTNTNLRERSLSTPPVKEELVSPQSTTKKLRGRNYTAASPKLRAASPEASHKVLVKEDLISPQKKPRGRPGRPKKRSVSTVTADGASPPRSNITLEERVKTNSKPKVVRSPYFSSSKEVPKKPAGFRREKTDNVVPPRSPFNLIQEDLFHDPWQMLIATIFLNSTSGRVAIPLALEFLKRWPTPQQACQAQLYDILDVIEPLGFGRTRAAIIIRFSHEFLTKDWKLPSELYGIGKYGSDSYKIFCMKNAWKRVESDDPMLMMYLNWRKATEHLRKRFMNSDSSSKDPDESLSVATNSVKSLSSPKDKCSPSPRKKLRTRTATK